MAGEDDTSFLSQEYRDILAQADQIRQNFTDQPKMLSYLWTLITDFYGDISKIQGRHNVQLSVKQLREMLKSNCSHQELSQFFAQ